jgi:hypothetical protein
MKAIKMFKMKATGMPGWLGGSLYLYQNANGKLRKLNVAMK